MSHCTNFARVHFTRVILYVMMIHRCNKPIIIIINSNCVSRSLIKWKKNVSFMLTRKFTTYNLNFISAFCWREKSIPACVYASRGWTKLRRICSSHYISVRYFELFGAKMRIKSCELESAVSKIYVSEPLSWDEIFNIVQIDQLNLDISCFKKL